MRKLLEQQILSAAKEIESIKDEESRVCIRLDFIRLLNDTLSSENSITLDTVVELEAGKEAIKEDKPKKKNKKSSKKEEVEAQEEIKETMEEAESTIVDEDSTDIGIELQEEETDIPNNGTSKIIIKDVDCTETYNLIPDDVNEDERQEIAYYLSIEKASIAIYQELISETNLSHSSNLLRLAYDLISIDLDDINMILAEFSEGVLNNIYEDLTDDNIEAFVDYVDLKFEEE